MRAGSRGFLVAIGVSISLLVGCTPLQSGRARNLWDTYNPLGFVSPSTRDKVVIRSVLVDQPLGDPYLSRELWSGTLSPLAADQAALLAENGFRVGIFPSNPPGELLSRINNEDSALKPNEGTVTIGEAKTLGVNGPIPRAVFGTYTEIGAQATVHELSGAEFAFSVTPTMLEGGKIKLSFEPRTQHGTKQGWLRPTIDGTGFSWLDSKAHDRFTKLSFDVTVSPGEYVVIGPTEQPTDKLGGATFVMNDTLGRMRVLVVRAWRGPEMTNEGPAAPGRRLNRAIAAQAGQPMARGQRP
jgi:hypothetical protein